MRLMFSETCAVSRVTIAEDDGSLAGLEGKESYGPAGTVELQIESRVREWAAGPAGDRSVMRYMGWAKNGTDIRFDDVITRPDGTQLRVVVVDQLRDHRGRLEHMEIAFNSVSDILLDNA